MLVHCHVVLHGSVVCFFEETGLILELNRKIRAQSRHLIVVHILIPDHLVDQDVLRLAISLINDAGVGGMRLVILEQTVGHSLVLQEDLVLQDFLGGGVGVQKLDLGLRAWDVVSLVVVVLFKAGFDALDWLVHLANVAGGSASEFSEVVH